LGIPDRLGNVRVARFSAIAEGQVAQAIKTAYTDMSNRHLVCNAQSPYTFAENG